MSVLIACEESQVVTIEFRKLGIEAYSCDILPCSGGHPEWHIQDDVSPLLKNNWDMIIAFPPCTHLSIAGSVYWKQKQMDGRQQKAIDFFKQFTFIDCPVAIENPVGIMSTIYRKPDQYIEPYQFGHKYKKKTGLWLYGLPKLQSTNLVEPSAYWVQPSGRTYRNQSAKLNYKGGHRDPIKRSKTFPGIAKAMAEQWSKCIISD